jgi:hypothetical protein
MPETPCHGDMFHIQQQFETVANSLSRQAQGATSQRLKLEEQIAKARLTSQVTRQMTSKLVQAKRVERCLMPLAKDIKTLLQWLSHDVLELAGPPLGIRLELFDFIVSQLQQRECKEHPKIVALRKSLHNQRDEVLAFSEVLDQKLAEIAHRFKMPLQKVRDVCLLHRKQSPKQLMTGQPHPHWLELLGFKRFKRA